MRKPVAYLWVIALITLGCARAGRYPPRPPTADKNEEPEVGSSVPADWTWLEPRPAVDVPIVFVPATAAEWSSLPRYWNMAPVPPLGLPTIHLGLEPLHAVAASALAEQARSVRIKVPRGLPDPTPWLPAGNPPTLAKWRLGKKLFFAEILPISNAEPITRADRTSCAHCHRPEHGFAEKLATNHLGDRNTPSLINVVYRKQFFWDGRADSLEQTIVRDRQDEKLPVADRPARHAWGGGVGVIRDDTEYRREFQEAFGIRRPTQDAIAQALATYVRTILSGDSAIDRAADPAGLNADTLAAALDDDLLKSGGGLKREAAAKQVVAGHALFHGKARCHFCHPPPLYFDGDFHNIGLEGSDVRQILGEDLGRFAFVPVGLKEARLRGAYRTPSLRALPRTGPYMHRGKMATVAAIIEFFDRGIAARSNQFLAKPLLESPGRARALELDSHEKAALALFLRALDGEPVDAMVASPKP